ncbi:MAG: dienelactone hydrolase family protein [Alcaligenaceae bacterium]|nr:MAG: dienelactone hydrolase family protein [Alcaligenaceae bacterium]
MHKNQASISTQDGACRAYFITPDGAGPWPAVILYGDAGGMRPAMLTMAERLASSGFAVLVPDLFYRFGPYAPLVPTEVFNGDVGAILGPLIATTGVDKAARDTEAFIAYLDSRNDVVGTRFGAVGFCMGGGLAIAAAGTFPTRIAAVASFHGGNLATAALDSPHLLVPGIAAELYVASAANDDTYPAAMAGRFEDALTQAEVRYVAETYQEAAHGWMVPDFPTFSPSAADRGWTQLVALLDRSLR